jgi:hypothetical protein
MGPTKLRLLFWGGVLMSGCNGAVDHANGGLDSADGGGGGVKSLEAGSGGRVLGSAGVGTGGSRAAAGSSVDPGGAAANGGVAAAGRSGSGTGGAAVGGGSGAAAVGGAGGAAASAAGSGGKSDAAVPTEKFSFFVTSLDAMKRLSKSENGFGGDLRYGEASGLAGADKICTEIAEGSMPGAGAKVWHAFLSAKAAGPSSGVVHAKDRIGQGPWYDRTGRLVAMDLSALLNTRPDGDPAVSDNLPNESGQPNRADEEVDNHDTVTGSSEAGEYSGGATCEDWTSTSAPAADSGSGGRGGGRGGGSNGPMCGHSWPAQSGQSWIQAHNAPGCAPSVSLVQMGGGSGDGIGNGGGYGGIYCFALSP